MSTHPAFAVAATIRNGFDVIELDGTTYLRVIAASRPTYAVPQTSAELRKVAAMILNAADEIDRVA